MGTLRGHQGTLKLFRQGQDANIVNITNAEANQDSTFIRSFFVGAQLPVGDQSIEGFSGSIDVEVTGPEVDDVIDAISTQNLNGIGVEQITMVLTEFYADGTNRSYVYFDMQLRMSKRNPGQTEKLTKRLEFQASGRVPL